MNLKFILINLILINLFTDNEVDEPVRLGKPVSKLSWNKQLNSFIEKNFYLIALALFICLLIVLTIVCFIIIQSGTESGLVYNKLGGMI